MGLCWIHEGCEKETKIRKRNCDEVVYLMVFNPWIYARAVRLN